MVSIGRRKRLALMIIVAALRKDGRCLPKEDSRESDGEMRLLSSLCEARREAMTASEAASNAWEMEEETESTETLRL
jgi:hypothetical protein